MTDHGAREYHEAPRSYASLGYFVALIVVGYLIDLLLGGGKAHLIGWAIALVVIVGLNFLMIYAVRSQKSLHVTAETVRIGDATIVRPGIVAFARPADPGQLAVLGWPGGLPRSLKGVPVRLADGVEVVIPTRFPDRLRAALGVAEEPAASARPEVRAAARRDLPLLPEVAERAEVVFRAAGHELPSRPLPLPALEAAKAVYVAGEPPVGFVVVEEVDGLAHVREHAVLPGWMGRGLGRDLLERACAWAARAGYPAITLTAFADVTWNAPFYARHGFAVLEDAELTPGLAARREAERAAGLDEAGPRVVMRRELG